MPIAPTYPGVYVQEVPSGVRTIAGVSTSIALFIGMTKKGPLNQPIRCPNYTEFVRNFSDDTSVGDLPRAVKLFFTNGGTDCYVMRIAQGVGYSNVTLQAEDGLTPTLDLTAKSPGSEGEWIRTAVTYNGLQPESTFNITIFSWKFDGGGNKSAEASETFSGLSMDPASSRYAPTFITQNSKLVEAALHASAPTPVDGYSISGRPVPYDSSTDSTFVAAWDALIGSNGPGKRFQISVDGNAYVTVDLGTIDVSAINAASARTTDLPAAIKAAIEDAYSATGIAGLSVTVLFEDGPDPLTAFGSSDKTSLLKIRSDNKGDVLVKAAGSDDAALLMMLGTENGGIEVSAHSTLRPAPNGVVFKANDPAQWNALGSVEQQKIQYLKIDEVDALTGAPSVATFEITGLQTTSGTDPLWVDGYIGSGNGNSDGLREKLAIIRDAINERALSNKKTFLYKAELWGHRIAILPTSGDDNFIPVNFALIESDGTTAVTELASSFILNTFYSSVGASGASKGFQTSALSAASDGTAPSATEYDSAYLIVDDQVDLFNLMILPPSTDATAPPQTDLWGAASVFCQNRRAFLLMDPPSNWTSAQAAADGADALRVGLAKDYAAVFYPRVTINENGLKMDVGPSGAIAGLMARIDSSRGVWKAPAGIEADLRGVVGLEYELSDAQNGFINPRAINTIRVYPNGIVNWGARTMDGDDDFGSEYKYIPVRRLALFMEESLYRGLKWVVFEPNDEPLWAQIRLNVGAFMNGLFRQGAFQGQTPTDAYFVKCDAETTTQNDINLGIVNIIVGFAPLKPAEFVILTIQQMAGQLET
ncbi:MAG: phage tail sheath subtilisin-like domain-containing protein [Desulfobacterales bacterium]|nr:phage tail sheath subtilisin-like domain-containing protein [Desulfobacterales bacterium]